MCNLLNVSKDKRGFGFENRRKCENTKYLHSFVWLAGTNKNDFLCVWKRALKFHAVVLPVERAVVEVHTLLTLQSLLTFSTTQTPKYGILQIKIVILLDVDTNLVLKLVFENNWWCYNDSANLYIESKSLYAMQMEKMQEQNTLEC